MTIGLCRNKEKGDRHLKGSCESDDLISIESLNSPFFKAAFSLGNGGATNMAAQVRRELRSRFILRETSKAPDLLEFPGNNLTRRQAVGVELLLHDLKS
jgi:hypothetical protein